jgi:hypothetical protein
MAEVSEVESVKSAREKYEVDRKSERHYLKGDRLLVEVSTKVILTPLLTPLRAQHAETLGNHQQGNQLR